MGVYDQRLFRVSPGLILSVRLGRVEFGWAIVEYLRTANPLRCASVLVDT